ncbi:MAG: protein kinase [Planctomycetes bacterium]|nr:protein kinase [Planctomycetota bacterium]
MHAGCDELPPPDPDQVLASELLDAEPERRQELLQALQVRDPQRAAAVAGMLATLEEFGLLGEPNAAAAVQTRIGPFRLLSVLGRGGMGTVHLAEQDGLGRRVALKVIDSRLASSPRARERFRREALAAARLEHPAICPIYATGEAEGTAWIAMRFVAGDTLRQRIERAAAEGKPMRFETAFRLVAAVADGLHAAHEAGVVHRDVKPGNILVGAFDQPVLVDFGLATAADDQAERLTLSGEQVGTPHYMAPEQIAGRPVDRRADVYALGAVLYECLTLRPPFDAVRRESLYRQILREEPEDPRRHNRALGRDAVTVVRTALTKEPDRRYRTAALFAEDLRRLLAHQPIRARRAGPLLRLRRFAERNPLAAGFVSFLLAAVVAFAVLLADNQRWLATAQANEQALRANEQGARAPARGLERALAAVRQQANIDTVSALHHAVQRHRIAAVLPHHGAAWRAQFAPQGDRLVTCAEDQCARLWDRQGRQLAVMLHNGNVLWCEFSRDGQRIATASDDGCARLFDRDGRLLHRLEHGHARHPGQALLETGAGCIVVRAQFAPAGDRVATTCSDGLARIWECASGRLLHTLAGADQYVEPLAWSADGTLVAFAETDNDMALDRGPYDLQVWRVDAKGAQRRHAFASPRSWNDIDFAPDGTTVLACSRDRTARVFDVRSGAETAVLRHPANVWLAVFAPDGRHVLTSGSDHVVRLWDPDGRVVREQSFEGHPRAGFLDDGRIVVAYQAGAGIMVLDAMLHPEHTLLGHADTIYRAPHLSPDGRQLASASWDKTVIVWSLFDPELPRLPAHTSAVRAMVELPDGSIASVGEDQQFCRSDLRTGAIRRQANGPAPRSLALTADGRRLLVVHDGHHGEAEVRLLDAASATVLAHHPVGGIDVAGLLLPGDRLLTVSSLGTGDNQPSVREPDGSTRPWGRPIALRGFQLAFSAPRNRVALAGWSRRIHVHDADGTQLGWWRGHDDWIYALAFDSTGDRLASSSRDGLVKLWDLRNWQQAPAAEPPPCVVLAGHEGRVDVLAWSPDGRLVASAASDGTARIWDASSGQVRTVLRGHNLTTALLFPRDGRFLLTGGTDGTIQAWLTDDAHLLARAERALVASRPVPPATPATLHRLGAALAEHDLAQVAVLAEELFARAADEQDWFQFDCLAWRLVGSPVVGSEQIALALTAANEAVRLSGGGNWSPLDTLAEVHAARGEWPQAVAAMERAVACCDHERLRQKLAQHRQAAARSR